MISVLFVELTWWQVGLLIVYALYTLGRAYAYFLEGIKYSLLGYHKREVRLYHVIWLVIDIPSIVLGRFYHVLKFIFSVKVFSFKE